MIDYGNGELKETRETVCVPVERYEKLILAERCMDTVTTQIAEDWSVAADNGYMEPTGFMKALLAVYNPDLYAATVGAVERIKADNRMRREAAESFAEAGKAAAKAASSLKKTVHALSELREDSESESNTGDAHLPFPGKVQTDLF